MRLENFKRIPGFNDYLVDENGVIVSTRVYRGNPNGLPHVIRPYVDRSGYMAVSLRNNSGTKKNIFVHVAVASAFIPNPENYKYVNHKDRNPKNNAVNNLEWCSLEYNNNYSFTHGCEGKGCSCRLIYKGALVDNFPSMASAARYAVKKL